VLNLPDDQFYSAPGSGLMGILLMQKHAKMATKQKVLQFLYAKLFWFYKV
jgi:hypothetical protein